MKKHSRDISNCTHGADRFCSLNPDKVFLKKSNNHKKKKKEKKESKVATIDTLKCQLSNKNRKTDKEMENGGSCSVIRAECQ